MGTDTNDKPQNSFIFQSNAREVMRISATGITVPADLTVDEAARGVIEVLDRYVVDMVWREVQKEREECAKILDANADACVHGGMVMDVLLSNAAAIRARGQA